MSVIKLALVDMGEAAGAAAPQVAVLLKHSEPGVRGSAAWVLGHMGAAGAAFAPQVAALLNDSDPEVHETAADALKYMRAAGE